MADLRIVDAPEILLQDVEDGLKLPTGGFGNYAITMSTISDWLVRYKDLALKSYVDIELSKKADKSYVDSELNLKANSADVDADLVLKADKSYVDIELNLKANSTDVDASLGLKASKSYVDIQDSSLQSQINQKATASYVDTALSQLSTVASKFYPTLAEANADVANVEVNQPVQVGESANGGLWYKATAGATTLTKSAYDPLTQAEADATTKANASEANAKSYTDQKTALKVDGVLGKNLFDKSKVTDGKGLNDTGAEITASTRSVSDFIPVLPNTTYSFTSIRKACFYDANKDFVQLVEISLGNTTSNADASFLRLDVDTVLLDVAQVEKGVTRTFYEPFGVVLKEESISDKQIKNHSLSGSKLKSMSITTRHFDDATFLNMHNATTLRKGITLNLNNGYTETANASFDVTDFIPCKPNKTYTANALSRVFFYTDDGTFISVSADSTFTTPTNCYQLRFNLSAAVSFRFQLNEGTTTPSVVPQPYKFILNQLYIPPQTKAELSATLGRKINFSDAWYAWRNNEKFPIAFLGDSTTNGNGTTGFAYRTAGASLGQDYIAPNSYTSVFQALIREITGNTLMRAYNAGFSGRNATWALTNLDAIFGEAYSDVKMIGISLGINDRTASASLYARNFYRDIEGIIQWCFNKGIQPFLLTSQPCTIPAWTGEGTGSDIQEVANEIKKNLADKYDLELVDVSKFGEQFMQYSTKPLLNNIMESGSNVIHFGDGGHKFTAELIFANFCKRCIWTQDGEQLDYATQLMKSQIEHTQIKQITPFKQGFKVELNTTQTEAENKLLQEFWVFNAGRKQLNLTAHYANAVTSQYVEVDGVQTTITEQGQALGSLDLGLHKLKAYSGSTTDLDWLGFKLI